ncbi:MBL fold metallo-hydrolase [Euryarchaeota archaeon]|nr:MBL fold metallo-hydrolase [Euryarchaeota archaeon]
MGMSITHLGTGSRGNATLLSSGSSHILVDQGFSGVQLEKRLKMLDVSPEDLEAIVITHHHGDHGGGALIAQKRWKVPVYANHRTNAELGLLPELTTPFEALDVLPFNNGISLLPVPVPHSGADNVAFVASHGGERSAIITDLGSWTDELVHHVRGCQHIAVEANYDRNRLMSGPYPSSLKDRITGRGGHLSNLQTGEFLAQVCTDKTRSITLTHLSEMNNAPHLAESTVLFEIDEVFEGDINISLQDGPQFSHFIGRRDGDGFATNAIQRIQREVL